MRSSNSSSPSSQPGLDSNSISSHSRSLATKLSGHMGLENAIRVSKENQWHGVLAALLELKSQ